LEEEKWKGINCKGRDCGKVAKGLHRRRMHRRAA